MENETPDEKSEKIPQFISIVLAFLFLLLFNLTITQERFYYHLIWGLESFPTKITIQLAIATCCLIAILLYEIIPGSMERFSHNVSKCS